MRRILLIFSLLISLAIVPLATLPAKAVDVINPICIDDKGRPLPADRTPAICRDNQPNGDNPIFGPTGVLTKAINIISLVLGITAIFVMIIAGIKFITSAGDPQKTASARNAIIYALVGLVVAGTAQFIVAFVLNKTG